MTANDVEIYFGSANKVADFFWDNPRSILPMEKTSGRANP
ncbi:Uncharacterised protein [Morganella morganii]|nr:Uncharacterised protein [Morganella morganii]